MQAIKHEFLLSEFVRACFHKGLARFCGLVGSDLELHITSLPSPTDVEETLNTLDRFANTDQEGLASLARSVRTLFSELYEGLYIPDLRERDRLLNSAHLRFERDATIRKIHTAPIDEISTMTLSEAAAERIGGNLLLAVKHLERCMYGAVLAAASEASPVERNSRIKEHLQAFVELVSAVGAAERWNIP